MCGITGFINNYADTAIGRRKSLLDQMCKVITHRGPDELGTAIEGRAALGMRRLSIIDLKGGQQPIYSEDGSKLIVFNGEIYNYRELKSELETLGYRFKTNSDTETIIHAYEEFGANCLNKLRGMFAFAIWDKKDESLFIARDRVGKKPLFYSHLPSGNFVFGSELKTILTHGEMSREIDHRALNAYLTFGYVPEDLCIFGDAQKLKPGHFLIFKDGKVKTEQFWDFNYKDIAEERDEAEYIEELRERIRDAVRCRLISDVPLGAFLSGGVDSSAVVGMMSEILDKPVKTFSIGFNEDSFNELKYARIAAKHFNTEHHEFIVTPQLVEIVDELVWHFDEPFADSSALPTYMVSKMARDFVTVVLTGDGGDEVFAGYSRYVVDKKRSGFEKIPIAIRKRLFKPISEMLPQRIPGKNFLYNITLEGINRYIDSISQFGNLKKKLLYSKKLKDNLDGDLSSCEEIYRNLFRQVSTGNPTDNLLYLDSKTYLPGDILTKVDRMSMAASLEARSPLLDHNLIDFVTQQIPTKLKLKGLETKYIFKKALKGIVPDEILYREKQGFGVPINEWINKELRGRIREDLLSKKTLERGYFEPKYIELLLNEHSKPGKDHSDPLWTLWMLELWQRRFVDE